MTHYHVRITLADADHDEVKTDMDEETLERQVLGPYRNAHMITINGKNISLDKIERIRISASEESSRQIVERLRVDDRNSSVVVIGGPSYSWRAAAYANDVTDQFITGPPGDPVAFTSDANPVGNPQEIDSELNSTPRGTQTGDPSAVFVVAGRDSAAISAVAELLRALGLRIVEWEHAVAKTGLPNPYVGDVVDAGLRMAGAAVIIFTPDDVVRLREDLLRDEDGSEESEPRGQARPNVYYEAGIADTLGRDRTVLVEIGNVKSFSDAAGRLVVRYDGSAAKRQALAGRLAVAGLRVNTGGQDWLSAGDISSALSAAREQISLKSQRTSRVTVNKEVLIEEIDELEAHLRSMKSKSGYEDLSDLAQESLLFVFRAQALVDRHAPNSSYTAEAARVISQPPHVRLPVLSAILVALRAEATP